MLPIDHVYQKLIVYPWYCYVKGDLDIVLSMYDLLEYSDNYSMAPGSL